MTLFKIELTDVDYDDYESAIVAANTLSEVVDLCEYGNAVYDCEICAVRKRFKCERSFSRSKYQKYKIEEIGNTDKYKEPTIIMSVFCGG